MQIEETRSVTRTRALFIAWSIVRILLLIAAASTLFLTTDYPIASTLGVAAILALLIYLDQSQVFRIWAALVTGVVMFTHLRTLADQTIISAKYQYVVDLDRTLFLGTVPTVWLQNRFYEFGQMSFFDSAMVSVHLSYFVIPYALAVGLAFWSRKHFSLYAAGILGTYWIGLLIYFLIPTSPPWLASINGHLPEVTRIVEVMGTGVSPEAYQEGYRVAGANDVAAMPSLHFGITALIMLAHWNFPWVIRGVFVVYTFLMGLALVYLAEHYVIDLLVGFAVALLAWWLANEWYRRWIEPAESEQPSAQ